jgi:tRNA G18 (ribose-2'-O)-methylase SpoU
VPLIPITTPSDSRLADYRNVPDPELLSARGVFVAEGRLVVSRLLTASRFDTRSVMVTPPALDSIADAIDPAGGLPVYVVAQALMNTVTGFNMHRGCLAIGVRRAPEPWTQVIEGARHVVVLEHVGNADNVGSIFRNAAAFGVGAVLLGPSCADPLYRKAIRTSMGAALSLPFAMANPWPDMLAQLKSLGFAVIALTPAEHAEPLGEVAARVATARTALVLGHEGEGLSDESLTLATHRARITMATGVDSLNVATSAAIALYAMRP